MSAAIKNHKPASQIYTEKLVEQKVVTAEEVEKFADARRSYLKKTLDALREKMDTGVYEDPTVTSAATGELDRSASPPVQTAVDEEELRKLNQSGLT